MLFTHARRGPVMLIALLFLVACQPAAPLTPDNRIVEITREVPMTQIVTQVVEQLVTVPVEITRLVEVTRVVEATRLVEVEVTRVVEVARAVTATPAPRPVAPPASTLTPDAVIAAIKAAGLEAENVHPLTREEYKLAPYVGSGLRFLLPSRGENYGGRIFLVPDPAERSSLRAFYEEMGKASAILSSYLYERENILLQLPGDIPEEIAQRYDAALQNAQ